MRAPVPGGMCRAMHSLASRNPVWLREANPELFLLEPPGSLESTRACREGLRTFRAVIGDPWRSIGGGSEPSRPDAGMLAVRRFSGFPSHPSRDQPGPEAKPPRMTAVSGAGGPAGKRSQSGVAAGPARWDRPGCLADQRCCACNLSRRDRRSAHTWLADSNGDRFETPEAVRSGV